jgi:hypothetical protein
MSAKTKTTTTAVKPEEVYETEDLPESDQQLRQSVRLI